jgi:hypothetical protein
MIYKRDEAGCCILYNKAIHAGHLARQNNEIKKLMMSQTCSSVRETRKEYRMLLGQPLGRKSER